MVAILSILVLLALIGAVIFLVLMVIGKIRKTPIKNQLICFGACVFAFFVFAVMMPSEPNDDAISEVSSQPSSASSSMVISQQTLTRKDELYNDIKKYLSDSDYGVRGLTVNETEYGFNVDIGFNEKEYVTSEDLRMVLLIDSKNVFKDLKEVPDITSVTLFWYNSLVDVYGNKQDAVIMKVMLTRSTMDKINFDNFSRDNLPTVADIYQEHPALSK